MKLHRVTNRLLAGRTPAFKAENKTRKRRRPAAPIEQLEPRLLLTVAIATNGKTATYTDLDDDFVTIAITKGSLTLGMFTTKSSGFEDQLQKIDFSGGGFDGTNITITAKRKTTGDGMANVGFIDSTGHDLGSVTINGDLGAINAGDNNPLTPALADLSVASMGRFDLDTQASGGTLTSTIVGKLSKLTVKGDVNTASLHVVRAATNADAIIGSISIGGSLVGGNTAATGNIEAGGDIGNISIGNDIIGGSGIISGGLVAGGKIGDLTIGGSIYGGNVHLGSGNVQAGASIGNINIHGSLIGGSASSSAVIESGGSIKSLTIGGSILGGFGNTTNMFSATIFIGQGIGAIKIGGDVKGGSVAQSGLIQCETRDIASLTIGGSLFGSAATNSGMITALAGAIGILKIAHDINGGIVNAPAEIKSVTVGGALIGGTFVGAGQITTLGDLTLLKIAGDVVGGSQQFSGYISGGSVGTVMIGGSVIGGSFQDTGRIISDNGIKSLTIGGSLRGGTADFAGSISCVAGNITNVTVLGSVIGTSYFYSGSIGSMSGDVLNIKIAGDLVGGNADNVTLADTGELFGIHIANVVIGGSVIAGTASNGGAFVASNGISAVTLGSISIGGSVVGNSSATVNITASGNVVPAITPDTVLKTLTVKGRVEHAKFYFGFDGAFVAHDADVQVGAIIVGGDWIASSLLAGIDPGQDGLIDTIDDTKLAGVNIRDGAAFSRIENIHIGGQVLGTPRSVSSTDSFGFEAEEIGAFFADGITYKLTPPPHADLANFPGTGDVGYREI